MAKQDNHVWMHFSDLMTGLMVIFLFVAISYLRKVNQSINVITDYVETKQNLYEKLQTEFQGEVRQWDMTIGKDLSIRFNNATVNFESGRAKLTPQFKSRLNEFIPRYLSILLSDGIRDRIEEIRIEGHTDTKPITTAARSYMDNLNLSQNRADSVLYYIRSMDYYTKELSSEDRQQLDYWICATGFSFSHTLDRDGNLTFESGNQPDDNASRRVEFRVLTLGDKVLEDFTSSLNR